MRSWWVAIVCVACGGGGAADDDGPPGEFDANAIAAELARAQCELQARCEPGVLDFLAQDLATCISERTATLLSGLSATQAVVEDGRAQFVESELDACIAALGTADCALGTPPCRFVHGVVAATGACRLGVECEDGTFCNSEVLGDCGACEATVGEGADCTTARCGDGLACIAAPNRTCLRVDIEENGACGAGIGLCRGHLRCVGASSKQTCRRPALLDQTCDPAELTAPSCDLLQLVTCVAGTCETFAFNAPAGSCAAPNACDLDGLCMSDACVAKPPAGQACLLGTCASDAFCDASICSALGGDGATCGSSAECERTLFCTGEPGVCGPLDATTCP